MKRITLTLPAPYVGLRPFDEKDALLFFGRDNHVRDLLAKLSNQQRFISVLGVSGSGKSSLVRAGLIPALHRGALASAGYHWNVHIFKPGDAPLHNLVHALTEDPHWIDNNDRPTSESSLRSLLTVSPLALTEQYRQRAERFGNEALLLVVDQFEEIFRYRQKNIDEAEAFIKLLLRTASEDVPIYVVMTMRSDFLGNCVAFFGLPEAINSGLYLTPRLGPDSLKSIIASPLTLVGGDIDPVLTNRLVNTLGGDDELPILEHALLRMWNHANDAGRDRIEAHDFETVCAPQHSEQADKAAKVAFAIDNHASAIFATLTEKQQQLAKQMFLALVERRDGRDVRRPQTLQQLTDLLGKDAQPDLQTIIGAFRAEQVGFLLPTSHEPIFGEILIDISHESLFRQWHLFQQWLKEEELDVAELKEWQQRAMRQQQGGGWLDEKDCIRAQHWCERVNIRVDAKQWALRYGDASIYEQVIGYIETSVQRLNEAKLEHERLQQVEKDKLQAQAFARASLRRSLVAMIAAGIAIGFTVVSVHFFFQADQAKMQAEMAQRLAISEKERVQELARDAKAEELATSAENLIKSNPDQSALLGLAAWNIKNIPKTDAFLRFSQIYFNYRSVLRGHEDRVISARFSPNGETIVTLSNDNTARLWNVIYGKEIHIFGHEKTINDVQFSPDGETIVTASEDGTVRLWNVTTGQEIRTLRGHENTISSVQFSPDGKTIVTASWDETARLWDADSGKEIRVLNGHESEIISAQFSPDGKTIVTAGSDSIARLWNVATGKEIFMLRGDKDSQIKVRFSADSKILMIINSNNILLWNVVTGKLLHALTGYERGIFNAQFSPDGRSIVTASEDAVRLWDIASGEKLHILRGHASLVYDVQFSPDGNFIVTASGDKTARVWDTASGEELHVLRGHASTVYSAQFSIDGKSIVTASEDSTARLWSVINNDEIMEFFGHTDNVYNVQFSPNDKILVSASQDMSVHAWDVVNSKALYFLHDARNPRFSPDGEAILTMSSDNTVHVWDVTTGKERYVLNGHVDTVYDAQFSPDGRNIVTASDDMTARVWDATAGKELYVLRGHKGRVYDAQFSPDGRNIVTASDDMTARVWDVASGMELYILYGHESIVTRSKFSPDGKSIVTISNDKTARVWDVASGKELHILSGNEGKVTMAVFSPDSKNIVTAAESSIFVDNYVHVWEAESGKELYTLGGGEIGFSSAQFSPDGKFIVTASGDKIVRLWDATTGKELDILRGYKNWIISAKFSSDGKVIVTASNDNSVRLWRCEVCRPIEEIAAELRKRVGRGLTEEERRRFGVMLGSIYFPN